MFRFCGLAHNVHQNNSQKNSARCVEKVERSVENGTKQTRDEYLRSFGNIVQEDRVKDSVSQILKRFR